MSQSIRKLAQEIRERMEEERQLVFAAFEAGNEGEGDLRDAEEAGDAFVNMQVEWLDELLDTILEEG